MLPPLLKQASKIIGGGVFNVSAMARAIGCPRTAIYSWGESPPPKYCLAIESATNGRITAAKLRPDVFGKKKKSQWVKHKVKSKRAQASP